MSADINEVKIAGRVKFTARPMGQQGGFNAVIERKNARGGTETFGLKSWDASIPDEQRVLLSEVGRPVVVHGRLRSGATTRKDEQGKTVFEIYIDPTRIELFGARPHSVPAPQPPPKPALKAEQQDNGDLPF